MFAVRDRQNTKALLRQDGYCQDPKAVKLDPTSGPIRFFEKQEDAQREVDRVANSGWANREVVKITWVLAFYVNGQRVTDCPYYAPKRGEDPSHLEDWTAKQGRAKRFNSFAEAKKCIEDEFAWVKGEEAVRPVRLVKGVKMIIEDKEQKGGLITPSADIFNN